MVHQRTRKSAAGGRRFGSAGALASRRPRLHTLLVTQGTNPNPPTSYVSLYATMFMVGVVMVSLGPILDPTLKDLHIPLSLGGLTSVGYAIGMLVGVLALNFALARVPVKWGLVGAAWLQTVGLAAAGVLARGLWSLFAAYVVVGAGCVFLNSLPGMWITSHIKVGTDRAMVVLLLSFAAGMMVTPLAIGGALGLGASWRWVLIVEAGLSLVLSIVLTVLPVSDIEGRQNLRLGRLREVIGFNPRLFGAVLGASVLYIGAEFILNVWLAKFEIDTFAVGKTVASLAVTLFWVGLVIGRTIVVPLTRRFRASRLLDGRCRGHGRLRPGGRPLHLARDVHGHVVPLGAGRVGGLPSHPQLLGPVPGVACGSGLLRGDHGRGSGADHLSLRGRSDRPLARLPGGHRARLRAGRRPVATVAVPASGVGAAREAAG